MLCTPHKRRTRVRGMEKMSLEVEQRMQGSRGNTFTFLDRQEVCLIHSLLA